MNRPEVLNVHRNGYKERRARAGFHAIPTCEFPVAPYTNKLIHSPVELLPLKPSRIWAKVFDRHHRQPHLGEVVTES